MASVKPYHFRKVDSVNPKAEVYSYEFDNDSQIVKVSTVNNGRSFTVLFMQKGADGKKYIHLYDYAESLIDAIEKVSKVAQEIRKHGYQVRARYKKK